MHDMLRKFVDVMTRKFIHSRKAPHAHGVDDFYGIEENSPDEAHCRVSDIRKLLEDRDRAIAACEALIKPPLNEDLQSAIDLARVALGETISPRSKVLGYNYGINRCDACKKDGTNVCTH